MGDESTAPSIHKWSPTAPGGLNRDKLDEVRSWKWDKYDKKQLENLSRGARGEVIARDWVNSAYRNRATLLAVWHRPGQTPAGVPVLDWLFETGDGEFVVVEAKSAKAELSHTRGRVIVFDPSGSGHFLDIPHQVQQFSPAWFRQRLEDLKNSGEQEFRRLAHRLELSWRAGKIRPLLIRAPPGAHTTELAMEVLDYADEWCAEWNVAPNFKVPQGAEIGATHAGAPIRKGASEQLSPVLQTRKIHEAEVKKLIKKINKLENSKVKAATASRKANRMLATAERKQVKVNSPGRKFWQSTKDEAAAVVDARKSAAAHAQAQLDSIQHELDAAKSEVNDLRSRIKALNKEYYRAQASSSGVAQSTATGTPAGTVSPDVRKARGIDAPGTSDKALETIVSQPDTSTAPYIERGTHGEIQLSPDAGGDAQRGARLIETGLHGARTETRLVRVLSLTRKVGVLVVSLFVPLTLLDLALEMAIWLYEWDQRRRTADEVEWGRICKFLFSNAGQIADPYVGAYEPAIGSYILNTLNQRLQSEGDPRNLLYWLDKWDKEPKWLGFVYAKISTRLVRQENEPQQRGVSPAPNPIRYFAYERRVDFAIWSIKSNRTKIVGETQQLAPQDAGNMFSGGQAGDPFNRPGGQGPVPSAGAQALRADWLHLYVKSTELAVRATAPTPTLTPFDIVVYKCRDLTLELLRYVSRFDDEFFVTDPFEKTKLFKKFWYEEIPYPKPFNKRLLDDCLKQLEVLLDLLQSHGAKEGETAEQGRDRRLKILERVASLKGPNKELSAIRTAVDNLPDDALVARYRPKQEPELTYISKIYLVNYAESIRASLKRMYLDMTSNGKARAHEYKYLGSYEE